MTRRSLGFQPASPAETAGSLRLVVARRGHRTRPTITESAGVLRLLQPLYLDESGQVTYIVVNPGGAYFGETYRLVVEAGPGAHLLLSSQGATRIYKTPVRPAVQEMTVSLAPGVASSTCRTK